MDAVWSAVCLLAAIAPGAKESLHSTIEPTHKLPAIGFIGTICRFFILTWKSENASARGTRTTIRCTATGFWTRIFHAALAQKRAAVWPMNIRMIRISGATRSRSNSARADALAEPLIYGARHTDLQRSKQTDNLNQPCRIASARPAMPDFSEQFDIELGADPPPPGREEKRSEGGSTGARRPCPTPPI